MVTEISCFAIIDLYCFNYFVFCTKFTCASQIDIQCTNGCNKILIDVYLLYCDDICCKFSVQTN